MKWSRYFLITTVTANTTIVGTPRVGYVCASNVPILTSVRTNGTKSANVTMVNVSVRIRQRKNELNDTFRNHRRRRPIINYWYIKRTRIMAASVNRLKTAPASGLRSALVSQGSFLSAYLFCMSTSKSKSAKKYHADNSKFILWINCLGSN